MENNTIDINIWDDFHEDGYVPEGEIQQTYGYVEGDVETLEEEKEILEYFMEEIISEANGKQEFKINLELYDSEILYPNLPKNMHYKRWHLKFTGITHSMVNLIYLHFTFLKFKGRKIRIYSES